MNGYDITLTSIIILIFLFLYLVPLMSVGVKNIRQNWVKYRCNPMVMPLASFFGEDPTKTFTYCTQTMMKDFMGYLLLPLQHSINIIQTTGGQFEESINDVRKVISSTRSFITSIVQDIFGILLNILVEIQKTMINMKDLVGKLVGIMTAILYMVSGTMDAMQSAWSGPPGQMTRALCFDPATKVRLENGELREMSQLELGNILKDGSVIEGVLKLRNTNGDTYYQLSGGENDATILVTGSHLIKDSSDNFIPVKNHPDARKSEKSNDFFYCLITSSQRIIIGERIFWDWNDDEIIKKQANNVA